MGDENGVAAVDRALSILDAMTGEKITLAELSKQTGLYKSTVLRLTQSLQKFGYILRSEDGTYRLGPKVLLLGSRYQKYFRTSEVVPPILRKLVDELHEGASFYIADADERVCLHRLNAFRAVQDVIHEGDRLPLTVGAAGHVLMSFSGAQGERFDQIRHAMHAASFGERDAETAAVACPIFGADQRLVGALSISGPRYRIEALGTSKILPILFKHAHSLTRTLGGDINAPGFSAWHLDKPTDGVIAEAEPPARPVTKSTARAPKGSSSTKKRLANSKTAANS